MKKILILFIVAMIATIMSCKKLKDLNTDTKSATDVPSQTLFSDALKALVDQETTPSVNLNVFRAFAQYWTETTYTDESQYNILNRKIPDNEFAAIYRNVLANLKESKRVIATETDVVATAAVRQNKTAITEILSVYAFQRLVDIFGNVPYDKSLDITNIEPAYDDASGIYAKLFARLDAAIANLNTGEKSFGSADLIYGGDVSKWKAFAYSLKLKMGIAVADVTSLDPGGKISSAVAGGVFTSAAQNASFSYLSASPNTNPVYTNLVASGRNDFVVANTIVDKMNTLSDPRRSNYFDSNLADSLGNVYYLGGPYGTKTTYVNYSHVASTIVSPSRAALLLDYTEVQFYLAEAAARGLVGGSAETYYDAGITASILYRGGTAADATAYLANPSVAYTTASGTYKDKIGTQAWIAYYDRGLIGWTTFRRLDLNFFNLPPGKLYVRTSFTFLIGEQTLNGTNYTAAAAAIGGDLLNTKIFWDK